MSVDGLEDLKVAPTTQLMGVQLITPAVYALVLNQIEVFCQHIALNTLGLTNR